MHFGNTFEFLYDHCMTTKKSYESYMNLYESEESCMMGDPVNIPSERKERYIAHSIRKWLKCNQ